MSLSLLDTFTVVNSHLRQDRYVASLARDSVSLVRIISRINTKIRENLHVTFPASKQEQPWAIAVSELEKLLMKSQCGLPITIVLSNQFVRYKIIPAMPALTAPTQVLAVAKHCFKEAYGDIADDWLIRVNPLPDGDSIIASAVDTSLVKMLEQITQKYKCKLKSIQPYLMSGFNAIRHQIKPLPSCYIQVESGRMTIALMRDGAWQCISGCSTGQDWSEPLSELIAREMLLAGWQDIKPIIYLDAANTLHETESSALFIKSADWESVQVSNRSIASSQHYAMALSVVR